MYPAMQLFGVISGFILLTHGHGRARRGCRRDRGRHWDLCVIRKEEGRGDLHPWRIIRSEIFDGDRYEKEKWWLVFNACTHPKHPDHLTLHEFTRALGILVPSRPSQARSSSMRSTTMETEWSTLQVLDSMSSGIYESE